MTMKKDELLNLYRAWLNPLGIVPEDLANALLSEQSKIGQIADKALKKMILIPPCPVDSFHAETRPLDEVYEMFEVSLGRGVIARSALLLRCLFDRETTIEDEPIAAPQFIEEDLDFKLSRDTSGLNRHYKALIGLGSSTDLGGLNWWASIINFRDEEAYEFRNALRYGIIFLLFHELAHIARRHFEERERLQLSEADREQFLVAERAMELDADWIAMLNLCVYIDNCARWEMESQTDEQKAEAKRLGMSEGFQEVIARGNHTRSAMFGIFSVFALSSPTNWTNSEFRNSRYFHPVSRIAFLMRRLDIQRFPIDGKPAFLVFDDIPDEDEDAVVPDGKGGTAPRWSWSQFFALALRDWDRKAGGFLLEMQRTHGLDLYPYPLNFHRFGLSYSKDTVKLLTEALNYRTDVMHTTEELFITGKGFREAFELDPATDVFGDERL